MDLMDLMDQNSSWILVSVYCAALQVRCMVRGMKGGKGTNKFENKVPVRQSSRYVKICAIRLAGDSGLGGTRRLI